MCLLFFVQRGIELYCFRTSEINPIVVLLGCCCRSSACYIERVRIIRYQMTRESSLQHLECSRGGACKSHLVISTLFVVFPFFNDTFAVRRHIIIPVLILIVRSPRFSFCMFRPSPSVPPLSPLFLLGLLASVHLLVARLSRPRIVIHQ